ncbi:hypothetical protein N8639_01955 [bacterium]|nr:hypothetical protein [bacterium]
MADQFKVRLTALVARLKAAAGTPAGGEAKLKASEANVFARKEDFVQANALLDEADDFLNSASDSTSGFSPETDSSLADQFKVRLTALVARLKAAAGTPAGGEAKLKASEANVFARKADFVQANALLDQADDLLNSATGGNAQQTAEASTPVVEWDAAKAIWREASESVDGQISKLQSALKATGTEELMEIAEFGLNGATGNFKVPLMAAIRNIDSAQADGRPKAVADALKIVNGFQNHIENDEAVLVVDENPFNVEVSIRDTLGGALKQMASALQASR